MKEHLWNKIRPQPLQNETMLLKLTWIICKFLYKHDHPLCIWFKRLLIEGEQTASNELQILRALWHFKHTCSYEWVHLNFNWLFSNSAVIWKPQDQEIDPGKKMNILREPKSFKNTMLWSLYIYCTTGLSCQPRLSLQKLTILFQTIFSIREL